MAAPVVLFRRLSGFLTVETRPGRSSGDFPQDRLVLVPDDIDLTRSPLAGHLDAETYVLGAFNPGLDAPAKRQPPDDGARGGSAARTRSATARSRIAHPAGTAGVSICARRLAAGVCATRADPRKFLLHGGGWKIMALTSLSLAPAGRADARGGLRWWPIHYDKAIAPQEQLPVLWHRGCAHQPGRRSLADDHLLGKPRAALDHAVHARAMGWTGASRASCSITRTRTC